MAAAAATGSGARCPARSPPVSRHQACTARRPALKQLPRCFRRSCNPAISRAAATSSAAAGAASAAAASADRLPFFPDRRCVEDIALPPLADCHHYVNLTNGIEAIPRLQAAGLQYRFLRLPSTRCEQQQWEALMGDLDADLLLRLAMGQCCLVYDLGSRNKKRGAPRAVWYGLEFVCWALRRLWLEERGPAYLRGHSVAHTFEQHVRGFSDQTKKRLKYFVRYIPAGGLPHLHLYGAYDATQHDGDKAMYAALLRACEPGSPASSPSSAAATAGTAAAAAAAAAPAGAELPAGTCSTDTAAEAQARQILDAAAAAAGRLPDQDRHALLHGADTHAAVEQLLGMRLYLGGISHAEFSRWAKATGFNPAELSGSGSSGSSGSWSSASSVDL